MLVLLSSLALADRINLLKAGAEQANYALQASENRLKQFLDALPMGVVILDAGQKLRYVNQWAVQTFARPDEQVSLGRHLDDIMAERFALYLAGAVLCARKNRLLPVLLILPFLFTFGLLFNLDAKRFFSNASASSGRMSRSRFWAEASE